MLGIFLTFASQSEKWIDAAADGQNDPNLTSSRSQIMSKKVYILLYF